jgi:hypothetical protein
MACTSLCGLDPYVPTEVKQKPLLLRVLDTLVAKTNTFVPHLASCARLV